MVDLFYSGGKAPKIGQVVRHKGLSLRRLPSGAQVSAAVARKTHKFPYISHSSCRNAPGAGDYTKDGKPIITSQRNLKEFVAHNRDDRMELD